MITVGVVALVLGFIFGYLTRRAYHLKDVDEIKSQATPADSPSGLVAPAAKSQVRCSHLKKTTCHLEKE